MSPRAPTSSLTLRMAAAVFVLLAATISVPPFRADTPVEAQLFKCKTCSHPI